MNITERNEQIRKDFADLQRRGWRVDDICNFLSDRSYAVKLSAIRIYDIVYREQSDTPKSNSAQENLFQDAK